MRLAVLLLCAALAGCSTVESRIEKHRGAYDRLSPTHQRLVQKGEIAEGMNRDAVLIAWGKPDQRMRGSDGGRNLETWIWYRYHQEMISDYEYVPRRVGRGHSWEPVYRPRSITHASLDRRVVFERGHVIAWEVAAW